MIRDRSRGSHDRSQNEVERARSGDPAVWREWFDAHFDRLYRYAYLRTHRHDEAEDIASQVFTEAVRSIKSYRGQGSVFSWLFGIEKNLIYDRLKSEQRRPEYDREQPTRGDVDDSLDAVPGSIDLLAALDELTDDQREAIVLRFYLGMSTREIAQVMRKHEAAVFSLQARALAALRRRLGEEFLR